jgi:biopolymer transport protein ExbD
MNFRNKDKHDFEVFTSSFSDIMFFLMLFFLITSTMITPSMIKLVLPKVDYSQSMNKTPKEIAISITGDLKYYINSKQVSFAELEPELLNFKKTHENVFVIVRCDNSIAVQSLIEVLQLGNKLEIKMVLATTKNDTSS